MTPALLVIDPINDIIHPDGKLASCAASVAEHDVLARINAAVSHARAQGWPVIWVSVGFDNPEREIPPRSKLFAGARSGAALKNGSWGTAFHDALDVADDLFIVKTRVNPFYGTKLAVQLAANDIDTLVIAGVSTTMAVQCAARDAHDRDLRVVVLTDACADRSAAQHQASLDALSLIAELRDTASLAELN
ncbi:isochorismatase family cysteine hydrolase [Crenobacter sp. SG2303]|uniref:Isochorismatase family cysteine hydrolase n=1 Tax=Crenobacter oryzisoli TaxID=3056844 RepID=A0ABT7XRV5_9NEIS|nr:isochorismatase family cysteine hydrolase [Crenobacter sp. SG2303]MDN0076460.1 isochorismatase family cysteine hydrolase [Crenobacter sp. SG2303]